MTFKKKFWADYKKIVNKYSNWKKIKNKAIKKEKK